MPVTAANTIFEMMRIAALIQHYLIIIGFQESRIALLKMLQQMLTGLANICKYANLHPIPRHSK